jgi:hypothetical protein
MPSPTSLDCPDLKQRGSIGGIGGKCRRGELAPCFAAIVRAVQFGAEMAVLERGINDAIGRQHVGHRDTWEADQARSPARTLAFKRKQAFARRYQQMIVHDFSAHLTDQPPDRACIT